MGDSQAEVGSGSEGVPDHGLDDNPDLVDAVDSIEEALIAEDDDDALSSQLSAVDGVTISDQATLQSLLANSTLATANPSGFQLAGTANGETIQIIAVPSTSDLVNAAGKVWHVLPNVNSSEIATIIVNQNENQNHADDLSSQSAGEAEEATNNGGMQVVDMVPVSGLSGVGIILPEIPMPSKPMPPGAPAWATRLQDCEVIGDSYRGWVETEVELDLLLTYHKQQTQSFWGTRQSPSPAKLSTRLMWKSQYVPYDGIPFINSGSRAIVMECQYGPRRKGAQIKRQGDHVIRSEFKQTCPARIYIKKVRKFPDYRVDITQDKKLLKATMEKAFHLLKERGVEGHGQDRFYIQLPTEKGHEYHADVAAPKPEPNGGSSSESEQQPHRLHPKVGQKIRDLVSSGETKLYVIRKILRRYVERELFESAEQVPERHDLTYYPTVNDLQNHIHQALKDVQAGLLPLTAPTLNVEFIANRQNPGNERVIWPAGAAGQPHAETVTVTLTQQPGEDGHHVISKVETHLSDGSTQISDNLTPETAQLLAKLHPNMFSTVDNVSELDSSHSTRITDSLLSEGAETDADVKDIKVDEDVDDLNSDILDNKGDPMEAIELQLQEDSTPSDGLDDLSIQVIGENHGAAPADSEDEDSQTNEDDVDDVHDGIHDDVHDDVHGDVHVVSAASLGNLEEGGQFIQHPDGSLQLIPASAFDGHQLQIDDESLKSLELAGKMPAHGLVALVTEDGQMVLHYNKSDEEAAANDLAMLKEEDMDASPY